MVIWTIAGMITGQIRSLKNFGWLAHCSIWLNILVLFMTMGIVAHSAPNYAAAMASLGVSPGPVQTVAINHQSFKPQIVGVMQIVYSYGGAMLFTEFMAEMRRPHDFIKAMAFAQGFIFVVYMMFGIFVYAYQGQFVINPANQGISTYGWQTVTNVLSLVAALIAAVLYGNIGIKVIYINIIEDLLGGPKMKTRAGRIGWILLVPAYWTLAFLVGSGVPQLSNISALVAALCILQFTYTFPPLLMLGFTVMTDALKADPAYQPGVEVSRIDTWRDMSRWKRGLGRFWYIKLFNFLLFLASMATAGLGSYSSIEGIKAAFKISSATAFGCNSPV